MENLGGDSHRKIIEELLRGRELANQLRYVLNEGGHNNDDDNGSTKSPLFAEKLVKEVLNTFSNSLLFLNNSTSESLHFQLRDASKSEDSQESNCKSTSVVKQRRGCHKRRKISQTWEKESEIPTEDGHQWRKYGQKLILHAKYPRNYYRCTHKYDQGCRATKQVQRIQEDPPLHKTTYCGQHSCRNMQNPDIIVDSVSPSVSSMLLSFDNSLPSLTKQECPFLSSSFPSSSSVKRECKEEISPPPSSSANYDYLSELTFEDEEEKINLSSTLDSDHVDLIPDMLYDHDFDDVFEPFLGIR